MRVLIITVLISISLGSLCALETTSSGNQKEEDIYMDMGTIANTQLSQSKVSDPIYMETEKTAASEIAEVVSQYQSVDKVNSGATELLDRMVKAYKEGNFQAFDQALQDKIENSSPAEILLLEKFVELLKRVNEEKLFGQDDHPFAKSEFIGMRNKCDLFMQKRLDQLRQNIDELESLYENMDPADVETILFKKYPNVELTEQLLASEKFQEAAQKETATDLHDFAAAYCKYRVNGVIGLNEDSLTEEQLIEALNILSRSFVARNQYVVPKFDSPLLNNLVRVVRLSSMLQQGEMDEKLMQEIRNDLQSSRCFEKYPQLWKRIASTLVDSCVNAPETLTQGENHAERVSSIFFETTKVAKKKSGLGTRMIKWFRNHRLLNRTWMRFKHSVIIKDDDARMLEINNLLFDFNNDNDASKSIHGVGVSEARKKELVEDVVFFTKKIKFKKEDFVEVRLRDFAQELDRLDPERTFVYKDLVPQLDETLGKEVLKILVELSKKPGSAPAEPGRIGIDPNQVNRDMRTLELALKQSPSEAHESTATTSTSSSGKERSGQSTQATSVDRSGDSQPVRKKGGRAVRRRANDMSQEEQEQRDVAVRRRFNAVGVGGEAHAR